LVAAGARKAPLFGRRNGELQQFGERRGSGLMHRRAHGHLDGFQIQTTCLAATSEDHLE
jgi:hypothetical protein